MATDTKAAKFNPRNPAVKRILQEIKEIQAETSTEYLAEALEDDIFEWHFMIRGPPDTEFEDFSKEERQKLAIKSRQDVPKFGSADRQRIIDEMHQQFLEMEAQGRRPSVSPASDNLTVAVSRTASTSAEIAPEAVDATPASPAMERQPSVAAPPPSPVNALPASSSMSLPAQDVPAMRPPPVQATVQTASGDWGLTMLAVALAMGIVAIVMRKVLAAMGYRAFAWT